MENPPVQLISIILEKGKGDFTYEVGSLSTGQWIPLVIGSGFSSFHGANQAAISQLEMAKKAIYRRYVKNQLRNYRRGENPGAA